MLSQVIGQRHALEIVKAREMGGGRNASNESAPKFRTHVRETKDKKK